jgi:hypothetical protein
MNITLIIWLIFASILALSFGILFGFFPHKVIQIRARLQKNIFNKAGYSDEDIDRLPIYPSLFRENYSDRLKTQIAKPNKYKYQILIARVIGFIVLLFTLLALWLIFPTILTVNIQ